GRLERVSETQLHLPSRREVLDLTESRELRTVDSAPDTRIVAREEEHRYRLLQRRGPVLPPLSIEEVEHVVYVDHHLDGMAGGGGEGFCRARVERPEPGVATAVALEDPSALPAQARIALDEWVEDVVVHRVLLRGSPEASGGAVTVDRDVSAVAGYIDCIVRHRPAADSVGVGVASDRVGVLRAGDARVPKRHPNAVRQTHRTVGIDAMRHFEQRRP